MKEQKENILLKDYNPTLEVVTKHMQDTMDQSLLDLIVGDYAKICDQLYTHHCNLLYIENKLHGCNGEEEKDKLEFDDTCTTKKLFSLKNILQNISDEIGVTINRLAKTV